MLHRLWKSQKRFSSSGWLAKVLDFVYFWSSVVYNSVIACFIDRFLQRKFIWVSYYRVFQIVVRVTVLITLAPESFWILFYIPKVILKLYLFFKKKKQNFMAPFHGWGSTASRLDPLWGGSLLFTTKFPKISGTHFTDLGRMKGWVGLGATQWFLNKGPLNSKSSAWSLGHCSI